MFIISYMFASSRLELITSVAGTPKGVAVSSKTTHDRDYLMRELVIIAIVKYCQCICILHIYVIVVLCDPRLGKL